MADFLTTCSTAPAVVYTALMGMAALYWLLVALGAFDIDLFHVDFDADASGDGIHPHGLLEFLSLGRVPITILATFLVTFAWFLCLVGEVALRGPLTTVMPAGAYAWVMGLGAFFAAIPLTGLAARPLRGAFSVQEAITKRGVVGSPMTITSVSADERFGTAVADLAGDEIILNVVTRPGVTMTKGEAGVVVEYDDARDVYLVAPLPHLRPGFLEAPVDGAPPAEPLAAPPLPSASPVRPGRETA
jgi:hypothetical protein